MSCGLVGAGTGVGSTLQQSGTRIGAGIVLAPHHIQPDVWRQSRATAAQVRVRTGYGSADNAMRASELLAQIRMSQWNNAQLVTGRGGKVTTVHTRFPSICV